MNLSFMNSMYMLTKQQLFCSLDKLQIYVEMPFIFLNVRENIGQLFRYSSIQFITFEVIEKSATQKNIICVYLCFFYWFSIGVHVVLQNHGTYTKHNHVKLAHANMEDVIVNYSEITIDRCKPNDNIHFIPTCAIPYHYLEIWCTIFKFSRRDLQNVLKVLMLL